MTVSVKMVTGELTVKRKSTIQRVGCVTLLQCNSDKVMMAMSERACPSLDDCVLCWEIADLSISLQISRTHTTEMGQSLLLTVVDFHKNSYLEKMS